MNVDRTTISEIVDEMLENPDENGIFPTSTCFTRLEHYIEHVRIEALGWMHGHCCAELDKGGDPRLLEVPKIIEMARKNLEVS